MKELVEFYSLKIREPFRYSRTFKISIFYINKFFKKKKCHSFLTVKKKDEPLNSRLAFNDTKTHFSIGRIELTPIECQSSN